MDLVGNVFGRLMREHSSAPDRDAFSALIAA
jgi:hypothetical protein